MVHYQMTQDGLMELYVSGKITKKEIDETWVQIRADMPAAKKVRLLEVVSDLQGVDPAAFWKDLRLGIPMMNRIERAAVVSDRTWIKAFTKIGNMITSGEFRTFEPGEIEEARAWLKAT